MLSSKRLQFVFRMSVITLVLLGTYSYVPVQAQYNTQEQNQAANQKTSGGLLSKLFKGDDPPNPTNNVAPANASQIPQSQQVARPTGTPVTPPPPTTRGGYSPASPVAATGTRPVQPQQNQVAQASPHNMANPPSSNRVPLTQTVNGTGGGIPESQQLRMEELYNRIDLSTNPPNTGPKAISIGGGPPSPPPLPGTEVEQPQQRIQNSVSTDRNTAKDQTADNLRDSISPDRKIENPIDIPADKPLRTVAPDASPKAVENVQEKPVPEPVLKDATQPVAQVPEPVIPSLPVQQQRQAQPVPNNERLIARQSPVLDIVPKVPKAMIVGKEETYEFVVANNSSVTAEAVVLNIALPRWAQNTQTPELTTGSTKQLPLNEEYGIFQWHVGQIAPNKSETLKLHLVIREKRPFELKYDYEVRQTAPITKIDVQQPVVKMEFEGPDEVLWGSEESYRLKIRNIGNGDAKDLMLMFSASGIIMAEAPIDSLPVGDERILDVAVQTREPDMKELQIKIQVTGPYGLSEETSKLVVIKRAVLELDIDAPGMQYVGNTLDYVLIARNSGTTASSNTVIEATLPLGVKYVSSTHNGELDPETNRVRWNVGTLPIGGRFDCMLVCEAKRDGECRLDAKATEKTGLEATANAATFVEAIADVLLDIEKPQDPIEAGATTEYVFTISNRGSKAAENVEVAVYFAPGAIEPLDVEIENARVNVARGEVVFDGIPILSAGETVKYRVKARGLISGNHRVQAMLVCQSTETQLTNQVMSRFYEGRNSRTSHLQPNNAPLRENQPYRSNTPSQGTSSLALGHTLQNDFRDMASPNTPATTPGIPIMPSRPTTNPVTNPQGTPATPSNAVNPLASSGPVTSRMQLSAADEESAIPMLNIPDLNFSPQPISAPTFGTPSTRPQRATGSVPTLSTPPVIDANRVSN